MLYFINFHCSSFFAYFSDLGIFKNIDVFHLSKKKRKNDSCYMHVITFFLNIGGSAINNVQFMTECSVRGC